jgi:hypothetical protein
MKTHVLRGSKTQIAEDVAKIEGDIDEAIIFVREPSDTIAPGEDIFAEMEPFTVKGGGPVDYSRESIYTRMKGE